MVTTIAIPPTDEEAPGHNPVTVLSYHYWQSSRSIDRRVS